MLITSNSRSAIGPLYNSRMALFDFVFNWWRHRREERSDSRDQMRLEREGRQELRDLLSELVESAPDVQQRDLARDTRFRTIFQLISDLEPTLFARPLQGRPSGITLPALLAGDSPASTAAALLEAVRVLCELGRFEEAHALIQFADGLSPTKEPVLIFAAAEVLAGLGRTDEALREIEHLSEAGVPRWQILRRQVLIYVGSGRLDEAMIAADKVIQREKQEAYGLTLRAYVQGHQGEQKAALATISEACEILPDDRNILGVKLAMAAMVDLEEAKGVADSVLAVDPTDVTAHEIKALWFLQENDIKAAREEASEILNLEPTISAFHHMLMARVLEKDGDYDASLDELARAAEMEPGNSRATWEKLGPIARKTISDPASSHEQTLNLISVLSAVIEHYQTDKRTRATAHMLRGVLLYAQGAGGIADADLRQAIRIGMPEAIEKLFVDFVDRSTAKGRPKGTS